MIKKVLNINGINRTLLIDPEDTLAKVLREQMMLTGCKVGCGVGQCGACTVIVDGKAVRSCVMKMKRIPDNAVIQTIEGIGSVENLHPLQVAWMGHGCAQCGFCSPGFIMSAKVLLEENPSPTREEVRHWFQAHRNVCRCTGYKPLIDAVMDAAKVMRGEMKKEDLLFKPVGNKILGHQLRPSLRCRKSHRHLGLRCGPGPQNALKYRQAGPGSGRNPPCAPQGDRLLRGRKDARRLQGHHP